jgi:outer membrane murein-binding lipoprotein Lpp
MPMNPQFIPDDAEVLFTVPLDPDSFTIIGTVPNQFPTGISLFITNEDPISTVQSQVIITRHRTANAANVYNRTMYIPPQQMAKLTNFVNIAGLNVFVKTSGAKSTAILIHTNTLDNGRSIYNATPTILNQDQTIVAMPPPVLGTSNSIDTQLLAINGKLAQAFGFINQLNNQVSSNYNNLNNKIGTLELLIQQLSNQIASGSNSLSSQIDTLSSDV